MSTKKSPEIPQGARFKKFCEGRGLTPPVIADTLGVSERTVYRMFEGTARVRRGAWVAVNAI